MTSKPKSFIFSFLMVSIAILLIPSRPLFAQPSYLLDRALNAIGARRGFISMPPDLYKCPFTPTIFKRWINMPTKAPIEVQVRARRIISNSHDPARWFREFIQIDDPNISYTLSPEELPLIHIPEGVPDFMKQVILRLLSSIGMAQMEFQKILKNVGKDKIQEINRYLYPVFRNEEEILFDEKSLIGAIGDSRSFNRDTALSCTISLLNAISDSIRKLKANRSLYDKVSELSFPTPYGNVVIGGTSSDIHRENAVLIIDLGGDDLYMGKTASGTNGRCSIVIDISGDDIYTGDNLTQGTGFWGIGILVDLDGNDLYRSEDLSQGAGFFGVGLLLDMAGNDRYLGGNFVQSASSFGVGAILDREGNDHYQCFGQAQAYASTSGISCLTDYEGNDTYIALGGEPDPREQDTSQSLSQGFAIGIRGLAGGGIGMLLDGSGNDNYLCEYFGQGSSYWMGVGILYDEQGRDIYNARRYAQGAGIHYSLGIFLDNDGNDKVSSWGVSQGCGHDYGIGLLVNGSGDDLYNSDWLSMGASEGNGTGIFLDNQGDDRYVLRGSGLGSGRLISSRRAGGLGIFIDAGGVDKYSQKGKDNSLWIDNPWSVGIDEDADGASGISLIPYEGGKYLPTNFTKAKEREESVLLELMKKAKEATIPVKIKYLIDIATHWGFNKEIPEHAKDMLFDIPPSVSIPYMIKRLGTHNILEIILLYDFFTINASLALPHLIQMINKTKEPRIKARALNILGRIRNPDGLEICIKNMHEKDLQIRASAIRAIGLIMDEGRISKIDKLEEIIDNYLKNKDPEAIRRYLQQDDNRAFLLSILTRIVPIDYREYKRFTQKELDQPNNNLESLISFIKSKKEIIMKTLDRWLYILRDRPLKCEKLIPGLKDKDPAVAGTTAFTLAQMGCKEAIPLLITMLKSDSLRVRDSVMLSLSMLGDEIIELLSQEMEKHGAQFKIISIELLSMIKSSKAREVIERYLDDPDPHVRRASSKALSQIKL